MINKKFANPCTQYKKDERAERNERFNINITVVTEVGQKDIEQIDI